MAVIDAVVAYDVSNDDARARLAALLSRCGVRLQRSVFAVRLNPDDLDRLVEDMRGLIDENHDVLHLFRQCATCDEAAVEIGQAPPDLHVDCWIV